MGTQSPLRIRALHELIDGFLQGLQSLGYKPLRAVLYGSYAKGKPHAYSDVDLAVWTSPAVTWHDRDQQAYLRLRSRYHPISPKFYNAGEGPDEDPFIGEILKTGRDVSLPQLTVS